MKMILVFAERLILEYNIFRCRGGFAEMIPNIERQQILEVNS